MKLICFLIILAFSLHASAQKSEPAVAFTHDKRNRTLPRDTLYFLIGYNASVTTGGTLDGCTGMKSFTKELTLKELEDFIIEANHKKFNKVVILALTSLSKKEYYTLWSASNNQTRL